MVELDIEPCSLWWPNCLNYPSDLISNIVICLQNIKREGARGKGHLLSTFLWVWVSLPRFVNSTEKLVMTKLSHYIHSCYSGLIVAYWDSSVVRKVACTCVVRLQEELAFIGEASFLTFFLILPLGLVDWPDTFSISIFGVCLHSYQ